DRVYPVCGDQDQPVRGAALTEPGVGQLSQQPGDALERHRRSEDRCQVPVFDRPLPGQRLALALRELPVGAGCSGVEALPWHGRAITRVEVGPPARNPLLELLPRLPWRLLGRGVWQHPSLLFYAAFGTMTGLMQSSSFDENMWYPSAMSSSGMRWVITSLG